MAATTPTIIDLQINRFCNCDGCVRRVETTLEEIGGVQLLSMHPDTGKLTVSTAKHPQVIQFALQRKLRKAVDILPQELINPPPNYNYGLNNINNNVQDMAEALLRVSHAPGLESVVYRQSNTVRFNFNQPSSSRLPAAGATYHDVRGSNGVGVNNVDFEYALPPTTEPSAPLIPASQDQVTGYPADQFYGTLAKSSRNDHYSHGCCTIL